MSPSIQPSTRDTLRIAIISDTHGHIDENIINISKIKSIDFFIYYELQDNYFFNYTALLKKYINLLGGVQGWIKK